MSYRKNILVEAAEPNMVLAGPEVPGANSPAFRRLNASDIPAIPLNKIDGWTNAEIALNALLPSQTNNAGKVLGTDGTSANWVNLPTLNFTGDVTGSGVSEIALTLANTGVTAGTYTAVTVDAKGRVISGSNPNTLAGYGITDAINVSQLGAPGGAAVLGEDGLIKSNQLPANILGGLTYIGTWDAAANEPALPIAAYENKGCYYKVSNPGNYEVNGITDWALGDWLISDGNKWDKIDNTESVSTVAGRTGNIVLSVTDVAGAAPLVSPALTGLPTAPTPVLTDKSNALATTEFVKNQQYLTDNKDIALAGDVTGTGNSNITVTLANVGTPGTYKSVTTDAKGRVIAGKLGEIVAIATKTEDYTLTTADSTVLVNAATLVTIKLPTEPEVGQLYNIKNISKNVVTVSGNGKLMDDVAQVTLGNFDNITVHFDGNQWWIL